MKVNRSNAGPWRWLVGALLLCLVAGLNHPDIKRQPVAEEASFLLMTESLWLDGDLVFDSTDARRAVMRWPQGSGPLALVSVDGWRTASFDLPVAYPLLALPFFALLGASGPVILNALLFILMIGSAYRHLAANTLQAKGWVGLYVGGFFGASAAAAHILVAQHQVLVMACLFFGALSWLRWRAERPETGPWPWAWIGGLLGIAISVHPALALVPLAIAIDLATDRNWRRLGAMILANLATLFLLLLPTLSWSLEDAPADRRWVTAENILLVDREAKEEDMPGRSRTPQPLNANAFLLESGYYLIGRFGGLVAYYPFALFAWVMFALSGVDRARLLLAGAVAALSLGSIWARATSLPAGVLGIREFASFYPLLLLLPGRVVVRRSLLIPYACAGLWTVHVLGGTLAASTGKDLSRYTRLPSFQLLPMELTRLGEADRFGWNTHRRGHTVWILPPDASADEARPTSFDFPANPASTDFWLITQRRLDRVKLVAKARSNALEVNSGIETVTVRFDSEAKRRGVPLEIAVQPAAADLGLFFPKERIYHLKMRALEGASASTTHPLQGFELEFDL